MDTPVKGPILSYGRVARRWHRRWVRLLIALVVLGVGGWLARPHIPRARQYAKLLSERRAAQLECLNYTHLLDKPLFDETSSYVPVAYAATRSEQASLRWRKNRASEPEAMLSVEDVGPRFIPGNGLDELLRLYQADGSVEYWSWDADYSNWPEPLWGHMPIAVYIPGEGTGIYCGGSSGWSPSGWHKPERFTCFLHGLRSPDGTHRLVIVRFDAGAFIWHDPHPFSAQILKAGYSIHGSLFIKRHPIKSFDLRPTTDEPFKLFPGQPDANDPSHFTMRYTIGTKEGVIDGWLEDGDTIRLEDRGAQATPSR